MITPPDAHYMRGGEGPRQHQALLGADPHHRERGALEQIVRRTPTPLGGALRAWGVSALVCSALTLGGLILTGALYPFVPWHPLRAAMEVVLGVPIAVVFIVASIRALRGLEAGRRLLVGCCVAVLLYTWLFGAYAVLVPVHAPTAAGGASYGRFEWVTDTVDSVYVIVLALVMWGSRRAHPWR